MKHHYPAVMLRSWLKADPQIGQQRPAAAQRGPDGSATIMSLRYLFPFAANLCGHNAQAHVHRLCRVGEYPNRNEVHARFGIGANVVEFYAA